VLGRFLDAEPLRTGLRRAGVHMARAVYEVAAGVGVFIEEIVSAVVDDDSDDEPPSGPIRIEVE
jgi:hypothetical protein